MPVLDFSFTYTQSFPIYPPLYAKFSGSIGAKVDLTFGYDTLGLQEFFASEDKNPADLLDGFFVKDVDDNGQEIVELTLTGGLTAGASIDLLVAEAGVQGGIFATVEFDLHDPNDDGKVRLSEIVALALEDIRCIFDIHGEITAALEAFLKVDLLILSIDKTWRFAEITLVEFDLVCPEPVLANYVDSGGNELTEADSNGMLRLNMGPFAGEREAGDTSDGNETFTVAHVSGDPNSGDGESITVSFNGIKQTYDGVKKIYADGGDGNDTIDLRSVLAPADATSFVSGGAGNDTIYAGQGGGTFHGDDGNDTIAGAEAEDDFAGANDTIYGDAGADKLTGHEGDDQLYGGEGADTIYGNDGNDTLDGGEGNDDLDGSDGNDTLSGGEGSDMLSGGDGTDTLSGGAGDDSLEGGRDDDKMAGNGGDDVMDGGVGNDVLVGDEGVIVSFLSVTGISGSGHDTLAGGPGGDVLFGGGGNDFLFGGTLFESGVTQTAEADGVDFLDGGSGHDTLFADDAHAALTESFPGASVSGLVWFDADQDGLQDAGETGMAVP